VRESRRILVAHPLQTPSTHGAIAWEPAYPALTIAQQTNVEPY